CFLPAVVLHDTAPAETYPLSLHDALPICDRPPCRDLDRPAPRLARRVLDCRDSLHARGDRRRDGDSLAAPEQPASCPRRTSRPRSEEHTSELQSRENLVCRLLLEKKKKNK